MEPPCRFCRRPAPPTNSELRNLHHYGSSVTRRREYCEPWRCHAKINTDLKSEFDSRSYDVGRVVNKIKELKRNVQDVGEFGRHDKTTKNIKRERSFEISPDTEITDIKTAHRAVENCLREMTKVKVFLEDDNSWWKILKSRSADCCQQKIPHLHGILDGSSVTLMLLGEADEVSHHFMTSTSTKRSDIAGFRTSSKESTGEINYTEQDANPPKEDTEKSTVSCYSIDMKSTMMEVASDRHNSTQQFVKGNTRSKQDTVSSEIWAKARKDRSNIQETSHCSSRSKDTMQYDDKEERTERLNAVPPGEIWYSRKTTQPDVPEDMLRPRETFSSENIEDIKRIDFESNVDLNTELPSRNTAGHKPRAKPMRCVQHTQKLLSKIARTRSRD